VHDFGDVVGRRARADEEGGSDLLIRLALIEEVADVMVAR
jgi:hypothetical protein